MVTKFILHRKTTRQPMMIVPHFHWTLIPTTTILISSVIIDGRVRVLLHLYRLISANQLLLVYSREKKIGCIRSLVRHR